MNKKEKDILILHSPTDLYKDKVVVLSPNYINGIDERFFRNMMVVSIGTQAPKFPKTCMSNVNSITETFKDKAYEGCRTPEAFRNDKGIYRQHKRQRKHK